MGEKIPYTTFETNHFGSAEFYLIRNRAGKEEKILLCYHTLGWAPTFLKHDWKYYSKTLKSIERFVNTGTIRHGRRIMSTKGFVKLVSSHNNSPFDSQFGNPEIFKAAI